MLGDVHLAEPNATIGFSGRRVIEQTIRETLPQGFQRSEFLVEHGMIDQVVTRAGIPENVFPPPDLTHDPGHDPIRASDAVIQRLRANHPTLIDLTTGRVERLLAVLDRPDLKLPPVIHVAGTNGKGSTIAFLRAALEAAGHGVHVYTSPHLVHFHERIRLARREGGRFLPGALVDEPRLVDVLEACETANGGAPIT
eukprot:gene34482-57256_t